MERVNGSIDRFDLLTKEWLQLSDEQRQQLMNHWNCILTCEDLKDAGLVDGDSDVDLPVVRMMFGFGVGCGVLPQTDEATIREQMALLAVQ